MKKIPNLRKEGNRTQWNEGGSVDRNQYRKLKWWFRENEIWNSDLNKWKKEIAIKNRIEMSKKSRQKTKKSN